MPIYKNVASQKLAVYAYDPTTAAGTDPSKTGDAANITAQISKDGAASAATNDTNPTELDATDHPGVYIFDLTQAETNADLILLSAASATSNILLDPVQVLTTPGDNAALDVNLTEIGGATQSATDLKDFADAGYDPSTNKVQGVVLVDTTTTNSDMRGTNSAALATVCTEVRLAELDAGNIPTDLTTIAGYIDTEVSAIKTKTDTIADIYHADIELTVDGANSRDEYTVTWFKNGVRLTSGITSPTIQAVKCADSTDLISSTAMTQIGSTGSYKYDEGTDRTTAGEAVVVITSATIDTGTRSFARVLARDSS